MSASAAERMLMRGLIAALVAGLLSARAAAGEHDRDDTAFNEIDPAEALVRMTDAVKTVEYEGTLVYLYGHHLSTLRIAHRIDGGESRESLLALNGPIRAVARNPHEVTCVLPDAHPISVKPPSESVLRRAAVNPVALSPYYLIHPLGQSRVAGRDTDVIGIIPRDDLRYGYRFYVDRATGLPLKTDLMDDTATPIEQVMFTELTVIGEPAGDDSGTPPAVEQAAPAEPEPIAGPGGDVDDAGGWYFEGLPPGFHVITHETDADAPEHLMVSDGLASVSVYIEPESGAGLRGAANIGAVHAAGQLIAGHQVTAVGEVPARTLDAILAGLRPGG